MKHRARAAALLTNGDRVLLVHHAGEGYDFWVPPGGGVEGEESVMDCAVRETLEETGLQVAVRKLAYTRQFIEPSTETHHFEFFFDAEIVGGALTPGTDYEDSEYFHQITEVVWVPRSEISPGTVVYPEVIRGDGFWAEVAAGFPEPRFLGVETDTLE